MKSSALNGILVGLIVVLVGVIVVQDSGSNIATARDVNESAVAPRGVGLATNGVIAVTGQFSDNKSVLYLIDTKREVILTYACYSKSRTTTGQFGTPILDFLNGRTYSWDAIYSQGSVFGRTERETPAQIRSAIEKLKNE
jgi:hypothetical protein